jgi:hypothetical protein
MIPQNTPACNKWFSFVLKNDGMHSFIPILRMVKATKITAVIDCRTRRTMPIIVVPMGYCAMNRSKIVYRALLTLKLKDGKKRISKACDITFVICSR